MAATAAMAAPPPSYRPRFSPMRRCIIVTATAAVSSERRRTVATSLIPKKKVLVPIGMGTEEIEAVVIVDVLRRAGADVLVASVEADLQVEGSSGTKIVADASIGDCLNEVFDLVALPGGMPGSARLRDCEALQKITCKQAEEKRLYSAICAAPAVVLKPWGLLRRKQVTGHPAFVDKLPTFWTVKSNIQVSGELTTSRGPGTALEFALTLVEQLFGSTVSEEIEENLLMPVNDGSSRKEEFNASEWSSVQNPRVLIPVANGSEGMDIAILVDILRRAKVNVVIASVERSTKILTSQKSTLIADLPISAAADSVYDLIILPGGDAGAERLHKSRVLKKMLKEQKLAGRIYGAICSSPAILRKQKLITKERIAAHPSVDDESDGQVVDGAGVVIDGKVITSRGRGSVMDFSLAIVGKLFGHSRARSVAEGIVYEYPRL